MNWRKLFRFFQRKPQLVFNSQRHFPRARFWLPDGGEHWMVSLNSAPALNSWIPRATSLVDMMVLAYERYPDHDVEIDLPASGQGLTITNWGERH